MICPGQWQGFASGLEALFLAAANCLDPRLLAGMNGSLRSRPGRDRFVRPHSVFPSPGSAPGAAAKGHEQLNLLEHAREPTALSGPRADRAGFLTVIRVEHAVLLYPGRGQHALPMELYHLPSPREPETPHPMRWRQPAGQAVVAEGKVRRCVCSHRSPGVACQPHLTIESASAVTADGWPHEKHLVLRLGRRGDDWSGHIDPKTQRGKPK